MRFWCVVACFGLTLVGLAVLPAQPAGHYSPGKDDGRCSRLVSRGVKPDLANTLSEALWVRTVAKAVDRIAIEVKSILWQLGVRSRCRLEEVPVTTDTRLSKAKASKSTKNKRARR
jgi:hypothetical protein